MSTEVKNWTANQLVFIAWLATPSSAREPHTQAELAEKLRVRPETLSRWKGDPDLIRTVGDTARELIGDDLPEIYSTLRRKAKQGSFPHLKMALELAGHYVEKRELTGKDGTPLTFTLKLGDDPDR